MNLTIRSYLLCLVLIALPLIAKAKTAYITDQIQVQLYTKNNTESPVLKLVATGTKLEVLQQGVDLSQVRTADGVTGWLNTAYITDKKPEQQAGGNTSDTLIKDQLGEETGKQINSLRLKIEELQAQLIQARNANENQENNQELYAHIARVEEEKIALEETIYALKHPAGEGSIKQDLENLFFNIDGRRSLIYLAIILIIGLVAGFILAEMLNRNRHSGFRL